jgi:2-dehydro-3-deoxyglucarate aldolase/4-hydroxy-2-oxoheptanedioate aldolase
VPGQFEDPSYLAALDSVAAACQKHGKAAGILIYDRSAVARLVEIGFTFIGIGSEGAFVAEGARQALAAVRA